MLYIVICFNTTTPENKIILDPYNQPSPLVNVNMARLLERYFGPRQMADIRYDHYFQDLAYKVVNYKKSKELNWAILDFAALLCQARRPKCEICIICDKCLFSKLTTQKNRVSDNCQLFFRTRYKFGSD